MVNESQIGSPNWSWHIRPHSGLQTLVRCSKEVREKVKRWETASYCAPEGWWGMASPDRPHPTVPMQAAGQERRGVAGHSLEPRSPGKSMVDEAALGPGCKVLSWVRAHVCISRVHSKAWAWLWCSYNIDWGPKSQSLRLKPDPGWTRGERPSPRPPSSPPMTTSCTIARQGWGLPSGPDMRWKAVLTRFCQTEGVLLCSCIMSYGTRRSAFSLYVLEFALSNSQEQPYPAWARFHQDLPPAIAGSGCMKKRLRADQAHTASSLGYF